MPNYTDPTITNDNTKESATHINELRTEYKRIESSVTLAANQPNVTWSEPIESQTIAKKVHIDELRNAINNLEGKFSNNCNCTENPNCCQACQSVTCQNGYCQSASCQTCQSNCNKSCQRTQCPYGESH